MAIYSAGGETFYSLNDRQAGIDRLSLMIRLPSGPVADEEQEVALPDDDTFIVRAPDPVGVVVMRALAGGEAEYERASEVLGRSSCRTTPS
jgi:uncharacterized membrane protein